jgi:hypothetical protein
MVVAGIAGTLFACSALVGIKDLSPAPPDEGDGGPSQDRGDDDGAADGGGQPTCLLDSGDGAPVVIASNQAQPFAIAVDPAPCGAGAVFWATNYCGAANGQVFMADKDGGRPVPLETGCMLDLVGSATHVAWAMLDEAHVAAIDGGARGFVGVSHADAYKVAIEGDFVYWGGGGVQIKRSRIGDVPCVGDACLLFNKGSALTGLAANESMIYWGQVDTTGQTNVAQLDGGGEVTIDPSGEGSSFAFGLDRIYWIGQAEIRSAPRGGGAGGTIVPRQGATALVLAGDRLYWTTNTGFVRSSDLNGQDIHDVAANQDQPVAIAADDDALYWVNRGSNQGTGEVVRMPR